LIHDSYMSTTEFEHSHNLNTTKLYPAPLVSIDRSLKWYINNRSTNSNNISIHYNNPILIAYCQRLNPSLLLMSALTYIYHFLPEYFYLLAVRLSFFILATFIIMAAGLGCHRLQHGCKSVPNYVTNNRLDYV